ncbi:MAG: ribonuclease R [Eubacterium sp.]|jgi:ribonuclease R|nr:ribonuclease R [Eubacterium sp.]MCH4046152.1 ribonuclease R [Eubacterium sp.]MCH4079247.1 ribonuclease R [Eubacterium sp.]MCH4110471.1 ribonuclease R [Eubacterium sp.]MCI1307982.1 ribonuclease R [Eubacterium sp.]
MSKRKHTPAIQGRLDKTKSGNGFVIMEDGDDIFIDQENMRGAMNGDLVHVDLLPEIYWDRRPEGIIDRVLDRGREEVIGTYHRTGKNGFVLPVAKNDKEAVFIRGHANGKAKDGDKVLARITRYPSRPDENAEGKIIDIIARKGAAGAEIKALIRSAGLHEQFPAPVEAEAARCAAETVTDEDLIRRKDLRDELILTIDGADSKDLDDAVSVKKLPDGNWILGVHIADVAHFVTEGSRLDKEAKKRGNSVYLLTRVIPMLPKSLSNGVCSLFEGADRLTLSCEMKISPSGEILSHEIFESVVRSKARMVYDDVSEMLEDDKSPFISQYSDYYGFDIYSALKDMAELAGILNKRRMEGGSIDFEHEEPEIILDNQEHPIDIHPADRRVANRLIEEFMLAANKTVAEHFCRMHVPFVYRVHEQPEAVKIEEMKHFLAFFGITLHTKKDSLPPEELSRILKLAEGKPYENIVSTVLLRAMTKAYYSPDCTGHYALAFKYYCHFTSPIRRYPDLMIHRIIKLILNGNKNELRRKSWVSAVEDASVHSSDTERAAQELERDVDKLKMAQYMKKFIDEEYDGIISGVTEFGIYVQLENTVEGLVPISTMNDDFYNFEESRYRLIGSSTNKIYALGDPVRIRVTDARPEERQIDFQLVSEEE